MHYLEIRGVPVPAEGVGTLAPVIDFAMQASAPDDLVELRLMHRDGRLRCYIGAMDPGREMLRLQLLLKRYRFTCDRAELPPPNPVRGMLLRKVDRMASESSRGDPEWGYQAHRLMPEALRLDVLYESLSLALEGCGYSLFFRRIDKLDNPQMSFLKRCIRTPEDLPAQLRDAAVRFWFCGCVFGTPAQMEILRGVLRESCPGLMLHDIKPQPMTADRIEDLVRCQLFSERRDPISELLQTTLLREEAEAVSDLRRLPQRWGIPHNPDTLFPLQQSARKAAEDTLLLGRGEDGTPQQLPLSALRKHMFVSGAPGTGKGNLIFSLAQQLHERNIPFLLIESAKEEQHHLQKKLPGLKVWRPKGGEYVLNPFSLPPNVTLGEYRQSLLQMMRTCFLLDGPMEGLFATTLSQCLARYGYTESSSLEDGTAIPFGLSEFMQEYNHLLTTNGYSERTKRDMRAAGITRLRPLLDQNPEVFDTAFSIPISELTQGENLLQLSALTTVESKQLFATILLISLGAWLRVNAPHQSGLRLVVIMDESHNLLRQAKNANGEQFSFAEDFQNLLLEMRSVGVGFVVADQSADHLPAMISEVCATKVFLGPSPFSGIGRYAELLKADQSVLDHLYLLRPGEGIWHTMGMSSGAFIRMEHVLDQYGLENRYQPSNAFLQRNRALTCASFLECAECRAAASCTLASKQSARRAAARLMLDHRTRLNRCLRSFYEAAEQADREKYEKAQSSYRGCLKALVRSACEMKGENCVCVLTQFVRVYCREVEYDCDHRGCVQNTLNKMHRDVMRILEQSEHRSEG